MVRMILCEYFRLFLAFDDLFFLLIFLREEIKIKDATVARLRKRMGWGGKKK